MTKAQIEEKDSQAEYEGMRGKSASKSFTQKSATKASDEGNLYMHNGKKLKIKELLAHPGCIKKKQGPIKLVNSGKQRQHSVVRLSRWTMTRTQLWLRQNQAKCLHESCKGRSMDFKLQKKVSKLRKQRLKLSKQGQLQLRKQIVMSNSPKLMRKAPVLEASHGVIRRVHLKPLRWI